jgi:hypothetical protein
MAPAKRSIVTLLIFAVAAAGQIATDQASVRLLISRFCLRSVAWTRTGTSLPSVCFSHPSVCLLPRTARLDKSRAQTATTMAKSTDTTRTFAKMTTRSSNCIAGTFLRQKQQRLPKQLGRRMQARRQPQTQRLVLP